ncbi:MAG: alpha/beta fold hydrolase [Gammaproteobacteria bacterium]|nr:alpha/beta fold hydrolase [Gammaproteobacteria bacterium]
MTSRELTVPAEDGYPLAGTLYEPAAAAAATAPLVVIAPGAAILRRFYGRFATYLAEHGATVLTFDYRAVGGSRRGRLEGSGVRMRDWCILDVPGVLTWVARFYGNRPIHWVGHSMGGFATGLAHNNRLIVRQLNVATLNGYWGRMAVPERYRVLLMMGGMGPIVVRACGYMPGRMIGGEDMPGPAFLEWRQWCMTPDFLFGDSTLVERANFPKLTAPLCCVQIADDPWGTEAAVGHMTAQYTGSRDRTIWRVTPTEAGVAKIGHFGFFRPEVRETLWRPAADWLLGASEGGRP